MDARPLRDLLADLVGDAGARQAYGSDPAGYLAAHGHPDLPEPLVAEAVVAYADTAPVEVAEVLAPYVAAHGPVPETAPATEDWFELLTSAQVPDADPDADLFDDPPETPDDWATDPGELDFGAGAEQIGEPDPPEATDDPTTPDEVPVADATPDPTWSPAPFTPEAPIEGLEDTEDNDPDEDPLD